MAGAKRRPFKEVYEALFPTLYRVAYRIVGDQGVAEDLCQEAFVQYLKRKEPFPDLDQTKFWMLRVVRNLALNIEKRKKRERRAVDRIGRESQQFTESFERKIVEDETRSEVQRALAKVPFNLRIVLVMKLYGDLSYRQIGETLGISEANVKVRVHRGRLKLAEIFSEETERSGGEGPHVS